MYKILKCYMADNGEKWCIIEDNGVRWWIEITTRKGYPPADVQDKALHDFNPVDE